MSGHLALCLGQCLAWWNLVVQLGPATEKLYRPLFLVRPYLQLPTPTGITIMWETNHRLPSRVDFGPTRALGLVRGSADPVSLHQVSLTDLQPGTTYWYRVRSGTLESGLYSFQTAPPAGAKKWRLAIYADSRSNPEIHRQIAAQIERAKVNLIVHMGDIVLDGKKYATWRQEWFEPLGELAGSVPWVSTIGNHEQDSARYFSYMALPGNERYFSFDFANAHIVCLDSNGWIEKGRDSKQYAWMAADLRRPRDTTWTFVAFHHPLFSAHATRPINPLRWEWAPVFLDPASRVNAVLNGHDHLYARTFPIGLLEGRPGGNVVFLTSGGGGAGLYRSKPRDYLAHQQSVHHFTLFEFDGDRANVSAIDLTGRVVDRFVLTSPQTTAKDVCAFEIEEFRQLLRLALAAAAPVSLNASETTAVRSQLRVPTRFGVPLSGKFHWEEVPGWRIARKIGNFQLMAGQPMLIPLEAVVAAGDFARTPMLTIEFETEKFRNNVVQCHPYKIAGAAGVEAASVRGQITLDGILSETSWKNRPSYTLIGLPPRGGRLGRVQLLKDGANLYIGAQVPLDWNTAAASNHPRSGSRQVYARPHLRVLLSTGTEKYSCAVTPDLYRFGTRGAKEQTFESWQFGSAVKDKLWTVEFSIPRQLLPITGDARINIHYRQPSASELIDFELCPSFTSGNNPDIIPDWKLTDVSERSAPLRLGQPDGRTGNHTDAGRLGR